MKSLLPISSLLVLLGTTSAFAADLNIPMDFEYLALDGKRIHSSAFNHKSRLELTPGNHKIAIRYSDMVEDDFTDSQTFVKSSPFIITLEVDGDYQYHLQPSEGKVVKKPKVYAKKPQVTLARSDKGMVDYQVTYTDIEEESFVSRLFTGNQSTDISNTAAAVTGTAGTVSTAAAAVTTSAPAAVQTAINATSLTPADASKATGTSPQQMLQYWWLQADEKTRKEFMSWAISQL